jgi:hypothetical protein
VHSSGHAPRFHCGRSSLISVDFVEPNFSERSLEIRALVQRKIIGRFHPRNNRSSFAQRRRPAHKKKELSAAAELFRFGPGEIQTAG